MKTIVTAGAKGADIDVFACVVAYAELLRLDGHEAIPVISGLFTSSVTPSVLAWGAQYKTEYTPDGSESFVLVDISDPEHFSPCVIHDRISEVYDHRYGYENYWRERLHENAHIEMVGSCGTLIWEQFKKGNQQKNISAVSAKLLLASIVSNNLAFRSSLTTERDRVAYTDLSALTGLADDWIAKYFLEQEQLLLSDFDRCVRADTKVIKVSNSDFIIGQIEMWDANNLLNQKQAELDAIMAKFGSVPWIMNILNISQGFNLIYSKSDRAKELCEQKVNFKFDGDVAKTDNLLLRKKLMKMLQE